MHLLPFTPVYVSKRREQLATQPADIHKDALKNTLAIMSPAQAGHSTPPIPAGLITLPEQGCVRRNTESTAWFEGSASGFPSLKQAPA